jgi:hypothetical protein
MQRLIVLFGEKDDDGSGKASYKITIPTHVRDMADHLVYASPDGTWRRTFTHEIVASGCRVIRAGEVSGLSDSDVWVWEGRQFKRAADIEMSEDDLYPEARYAKREVVPLLPNGAGPYCMFSVADLPTASGVYVFFVDGMMRYVGRAADLRRRFYQYGHISPKNCYLHGRSTNIRLNKHVREALRAGYEVEIFYHETSDYSVLEESMIATLQPLWNVQGKNSKGDPTA